MIQKLVTAKICLVLLFQYSVAQTSVPWAKYYGGSDHDYPACIIESNDGNYVVAGH